MNQNIFVVCDHPEYDLKLFFVILQCFFSRQAALLFPFFHKIFTTKPNHWIIHIFNVSCSVFFKNIFLYLPYILINIATSISVWIFMNVIDCFLNNCFCENNFSTVECRAALVNCWPIIQHAYSYHDANTFSNLPILWISTLQSYIYAALCIYLME